MYQLSERSLGDNPNSAESHDKGVNDLTLCKHRDKAYLNESTSTVPRS